MIQSSSIIFIFPNPKGCEALSIDLIKGALYISGTIWDRILKCSETETCLSSIVIPYSDKMQLVIKERIEYLNNNPKSGVSVSLEDTPLSVMIVGHIEACRNALHKDLLAYIPSIGIMYIEICGSSLALINSTGYNIEILLSISTNLTGSSLSKIFLYGEISKISYGKIVILIELDLKAGLLLRALEIPSTYHYFLKKQNGIPLQDIQIKHQVNIYLVDSEIVKQIEACRFVLIAGNLENCNLASQDIFIQLNSHSFSSEIYLSYEESFFLKEWCKQELELIELQNGCLLQYPSVYHRGKSIRIHCNTIQNTERACRQIEKLLEGFLEITFTSLEKGLNRDLKSTVKYNIKLSKELRRISAKVQIICTGSHYKIQGYADEVIKAALLVNTLLNPMLFHGLVKKNSKQIEIEKNLNLNKISTYEFGVTLLIRNEIFKVVTGNGLGKLHKILQNSQSLGIEIYKEGTQNSKIKNSSFQDKYFPRIFKISFHSSIFSEIIKALKIFQGELPAEISFYLPDKLHSDLIGPEGRRSKEIQEKYLMHIEFIRSDKLAAQGGGPLFVEDNVYIYTPRYNHQQLGACRNAIMEKLPKHAEGHRNWIHINLFIHQKLHRLLFKCYQSFEGFLKRFSVIVRFPSCSSGQNYITMIGPEAGVQQALEDLEARACQLEKELKSIEELTGRNHRFPRSAVSTSLTQIPNPPLVFDVRTCSFALVGNFSIAAPVSTPVFPRRIKERYPFCPPSWVSRRFSRGQDHPPRLFHLVFLSSSLSGGIMSAVQQPNNGGLELRLDDEPVGQDPTCNGCGAIIEEGSVVAFGDHIWHVECFRCAKCRTQVDHDSNLLLLSDGNPICENCSYNCRACNKKIDELAIMTGDESYHADCFRCRHCKRKIDDLVFAKTSQGIYCIDCHNERMARSRRHHKEKKAAQRAAAESSATSHPSPPFGMVKDKSLPKLPPSQSDECLPVRFSTQSAPSDTLKMLYSSSKSRNKSPSRDGQLSPSSNRSFLAMDNEHDLPSTDAFIPLVFDPSPPSPQPYNQQISRSRDLSQSKQVLDPSKAPDPSKLWTHRGAFDDSKLGVKPPSSKDKRRSMMVSSSMGQLPSPACQSPLLPFFSEPNAQHANPIRPIADKPPRKAPKPTPLQKPRTLPTTPSGMPVHSPGKHRSPVDCLTSPKPGLASSSFMKSPQKDVFPVSTMGSSEPLQKISPRSSNPVAVERSPVLPPLHEPITLTFEDDIAKIFADNDPSDEKSKAFLRLSQSLRHHRSLSDVSGQASEVARMSAMRRNNSKSQRPILKDSMVSTLNGNSGETDALKRELRKSTQRIVELQSQLVVLDNDTEREAVSMKETIASLEAVREILIKEIDILKGINENEFSGIEVRESILQDLKKALNNLKDAYKPKIAELIAQRDSLMEENVRLQRTRAQAIEEARFLNAKNLELADLNNELVRQIQESFKGSKRHIPKSQSQCTAASLPLSISTTAATITPSDLDRPRTQDTNDENVISVSKVIDRRRSQEINTTAPKKFKWKKGVAKGFNQLWNGIVLSKDLVKGHTFVESRFLRLTKCDHCGDKLWGLEVRCQSCGFGAHGKCIAEVVAACSGVNRQIMLRDGDSMSDHSLIEVPIFGNDLCKQAEVEGVPIPYIVARCIEEVEFRGMDYEGIYRKSGGASQMKVIIDLFESGQTDLDLTEPGGSGDICGVTSVLKQYFRQLPNPLITFEEYEDFLKVSQVVDIEERFAAMIMVLKRLPTPNYETLRFLLLHLNRVSEQADVNLMNTRNLAVVFSPTLVRDPTGLREFHDMQAKNLCVQFLIEHAERIFGRNLNG
ncbi:putative Rho-type GTPase-activating protein 3 [Neolecta irregularis DAH-3]|uniref:Putative Rho-type GTPase-activating protein 3 n=1 Tax=Neolecta irregularis (strain DAH-3) TaxID=1198029 RepID=A0A1U7LII8_NEOID|nr:putative Rho-type GTPase-activating protein 3 [Neolecta irregularis DAH-3]|eukprot:OLL22476.1 putative Rho-type GTPase-activating protein 3 [Neolecta irregularis DAH-3]